MNYCENNRTELYYVQSDKSQQNGFIERFNGSFRREFLNDYLFKSLSQVRKMVWFWQHDYNLNRPYESFHLPPESYHTQLENSNLMYLN